jgi:hypothetical protein
MAESRLPAIVVAIIALGALVFVAAGLIAADSPAGRLLRGESFRPGPKEAPSALAVVDGNGSEWVLAEDLFADLYRAGQENEKIQAQLYLRYDCRTNLVYALFLPAGEWPVLLRRSQVRLALDSASEEVPAVDFAWMEPGYDGNSQHTRGWEASFTAAPGEHLLWAAALVVDDGEVQEASTPNGGRAMILACDHSTTLFLKRLEAVATGGRVQLEWETAWEVNNLGFNVYHSSGRDGPWTRLNRELIESRATPQGIAGAQYEFVHAGVDLGADNYYLLEDVASDGIATRHGPVAP